MIRMLILYCLLPCLLFISGVLLATRAAPPSITLPGFAACALPCWAGITPGQIPYRMALRVLADHLPDMTLDFEPGLSQVNFVAQAPAANPFYGAIYEDRGQVGGLRLEVRLPVWHLIAQLGRPRCVAVHRTVTLSTRIANIYWQSGEIYIWGFLAFEDGIQWGPDSHTTSLFILHSDDPCAQPGVAGWRGFAPLRLYEAE